jgi:hypothetical protein
LTRPQVGEFEVAIRGHEKRQGKSRRSRPGRQVAVELSPEMIRNATR